MKTYRVSMPLTGFAYYEVDAENEEHAIWKASTSMNPPELEWDTDDANATAEEIPSVNESCRFMGWVDGFEERWDCDGRVALWETKNDLIATWTDPVPWDWSTTPPWINWIAMNSNRSWYMSTNEPVTCERDCDIHFTNGGYFYGIPLSHAPKWSGDWKLSKTQRPKEVK